MVRLSAAALLVYAAMVEILIKPAKRGRIVEDPDLPGYWWEEEE